MVIDWVSIRIFGTVTVATAAWNGRDVAALISSVSAELTDGTQRQPSIGGRPLRLAMQQSAGPARYEESGSIAVGAAQTVDVRVPIYFARHRSKRPEDYSVGCETFKRLVVTPAALASLGTGGAVISAPSLQVQAEFWYREESSIEVKSLDAWYITDFTSTQEAVMSAPGPIKEMYIVSTSNTTAGGGALITGLTDARCDSLGIPVVSFGRQRAAYRVLHERGNVGSAVAAEWLADPITDGLMFPVVLPETTRQKPWDGYAVTAPGGIKVNVNPATAGLQLLVRAAIPRSDALWNQTLMSFGLPAGNEAQLAGLLRGGKAGRVFTPEELRYAPLELALRTPPRRWGS